MNEKILPPVRPNVGVKLRYRAQMLSLIEEMNESILYWLTAQYRDAPPLLAQDARPYPSKEIQKRFKELAARWSKRFNKAARKIAEAYLKGSFKATDSAMRAALKKAGISVKFQMTPAMKDAFNASLSENVGLIKSIPDQYLLQVEGIVSRSYAAGRDLETMVKNLKSLYPKAQNRAILIARDQSNKANAVVERARRLELGIVEAEWMHSGGGKHPRPEHVKAGKEHRRFKVAEGCPIKNEKGELEFILPGEKINCRCVSRPVIPGLT